jgi:hypothetical protein
MAMLIIGILAKNSITYSPIIIDIYGNDKIFVSNNSLAGYGAIIDGYYNYILGVEVGDIKNIDIIEALNKCENSGRWDTTKILDINKKYSYGGLMFQLETLKRYGIEYGYLRKDITDIEIEKIIYDKNLQIEISDKMISDGFGKQNWYNCWNKEINSF